MTGIEIILLTVLVLIILSILGFSLAKLLGTKNNKKKKGN